MVAVAWVTVVAVVLAFVLLKAHVLAGVVLRGTTVVLSVDVQTDRSVEIKPLLHLKKGYPRG